MCMKKSLPFIVSSVFIIFGFLFLNVSPAQAATYYFCPGTGNWAIVGNWKADALCLTAGSIPGVGDDAVILVSIVSNSGSAASVNTMTVNGSVNTAIPVTVANGATFNNFSNTSGTITGNATFNFSAYNSGTVTGNATFNGNSFNNFGGTISGNAIFNDGSYNDSGSISASATFNATSYNYGTVSGDATFNSSSVNYNIISGDATFNGSSFNDASCGFFCAGTVSGNAIFYNSSHNDGTVAGLVGLINARFLDSTSNALGIVAGTACFASTANPIHGTVNNDQGLCISVLPPPPAPVHHPSGGRGRKIVPPTIVPPPPIVNETQCPYFATYHKRGELGDAIKHIQTFLEKENFNPGPIDGIYGQRTSDAIKMFQSKYFDEVLKPWNITVPTGRWYESTRFKANKLVGCGEGRVILDNGVEIN